MSDRQRIRRKDPERDAPIRSWSNMFRNPAATATSPSNGNGAAMGVPADDLVVQETTSGLASDGSASTHDQASEEARREVESAYRVIDAHLQEGRRAAQERSDEARATASGAYDMSALDSAGIRDATASLQEMIAQGVRFYSSLAPLWAEVVNAVAASAGVVNPSTSAGPAAPLAPAPMPRSAEAMGAAPISIEIASARPARVTIDLAPRASVTNLATTGLHAIEPGRPPLEDLAFTIDASTNRPILRVRVPDHQPAGVYNGVIVDKDSGDPRGTLTVRIEA